VPAPAIVAGSTAFSDLKARFATYETAKRQCLGTLAQCQVTRQTFWKMLRVAGA